MGPAGQPLRDTTLLFLVKRGQRLHNFCSINTVYGQTTELAEIAPQHARMHLEGKVRTFSKCVCAESLMVPIIRNISRTSDARQH